MARLPDLKRDQLDSEGQALWDTLIASRGYIGGPTACIMHHPALAAKSTPLGSQLRYSGVLAGADRELTILTAGPDARTCTGFPRTSTRTFSGESICTQRRRWTCGMPPAGFVTGISSRSPW